MDGETTKWVIGILITAATAAFSAVGGLFFYLFGRINDVAKKGSEGDKELHGRIEAVKDEYVRADHLRDHLSHIDLRLDGIQADGHTRHDVIGKRLDDIKNATESQLKEVRAELHSLVQQLNQSNR